MKKQLNPAFQEAEARIRVIVDTLESLKAVDITILDLRGIADFADYFVIATATSSTQMAAIIRRVYDALKAEGSLPYSPIEDESPRWSILDYGDVILHLFEQETREHYQLEQAWGDADVLPLDRLPELRQTAS